LTIVIQSWYDYYMQLRNCKTTRKWEQEMNTENMNAVICVFCETIIADKMDYSTTQFCADCNEYKGITTVGEYLTEYGMVMA
jgi:hypothetical protein